VVSQAATVRLKARKSNNIKVFIVFIQGHLLYFAFSHIDDIEFTGIKTGKILDFSPIKSVRRLRNGSRVFQQSEPGLQGIGQPFFPSHGLDLALITIRSLLWGQQIGSLLFPNSAYCPDMKGAGYDSEIERGLSMSLKS